MKKLLNKVVALFLQLLKMFEKAVFVLFVHLMTKLRSKVVVLSPQ